MSIPVELSEFDVDGVTPSAVLAPTSVTELQECMRTLHADGSAAIPWSGGTRVSVGNTPSEYDIALDLSGMPSQFEHEPGDMTVICDANVNIGELESVLNSANQRLPFRVPHASRATVGGSVASNAGGRLRPRFGGIRDWVVGMSVVSADGVLTKSGGRVVKNVQGFELHRLHTGAFGTLGVISSVAFKLVPLPRAAVTAAMWFADHESATQATALIAGNGYELDSVRLYFGNAAVSTIRDLSQDGGYDTYADETTGGYLLLAKLAGSSTSVRSQIESVRSESGTLPTLGFVEVNDPDDEIWDYLDSSTYDGELVVAFSGMHSDAARLMRRLDRLLAQAGYALTANMALDGGYGTLQLSIDSLDHGDASSLLESITAAARACDCTYLIERCPPEVKRDVDVFGVDPSLATIMRRTKQQYDPKSILNRGRFAFGI